MKCFFNAYSWNQHDISFYTVHEFKWKHPVNYAYHEKNIIFTCILMNTCTWNGIVQISFYSHGK